MNNKIILITQYYLVKNTDLEYTKKRQNEVDFCLLSNAKNKYIDEIHLLVENTFDLDFIPSEYYIKIKQIVMCKRLSYYDAFEYYNNNVPNEICILANADIYMDQSISILHNVNFNNIIMALNRYEDTIDEQTSINYNYLNGIFDDLCNRFKCPYLTPYQPSVWSQDAWIWKANEIQLDNKYDFHLGICGCDNHISYLLKNNGFNIINPSRHICVNHYDNLSTIKTEYGISKGNVSSKKNDRIGNMDSYLFLQNIDDIPDKYTTKIINTITNQKYPFIETTKFEKSVKEIYLNSGQIIASSYKDNHEPFNCLFNNNDFWEPLMTDNDPYIQFNFDNVFDITIIDIMGKVTSKDDLNLSFVELFNISYLGTNNKWVDYSDTLNGIQIKNTNYIKRNYLNKPIKCIQLRIFPLKAFNLNALKVRLYAIDYPKPNIYDYLIQNNIIAKNINMTMIDYEEINYFVDNLSVNDKKQIEINNIKYLNTLYNKNLLKQTIKEGICLYTYVMNRTNNIVNNIGSWLKQKIDQLIIIDWSSDEEFYDFINQLNDNRILYVRVNGEKYFIRTYAQNLAAKLCAYDKICKIDSDIILYDNFFEQHPINHGMFYVGEWRNARNENEKSTHGNIYLYLKDCLYVNGYNEFIKTYGWDDSDFTIRLMMLGLEKKIFNLNAFYHVPHSKTTRIVNLSMCTHPEVYTLTHKLILINQLMWSRKNNGLNYDIKHITDNYIICNAKPSETFFCPKIYEQYNMEAELIVFSWFKLNNVEHNNALKNKDYNFIKQYLNSI